MSWNKTKGNVIVVSVTVISMLAWLSQAGPVKVRHSFNFNKFRSVRSIRSVLPPDTISQDSIRNLQYQRSRRPTYQPTDRIGDPFSNRTSSSPLLLGTPGNVKLNVEMDDSLRYFEINETMGELDYRNPSTMTYQEYSRFQQQQAIRNYWRTKASGLDGESAISSKRLIPKIYISPAFDRIFGGNYVDIRPNGNVTLRFGARFNNTENPTLPIRLQRRGDFDFDQSISLNLIGNIGEKLKLTFNWDTKANFDFENNMKLDYTGYEEEIIRKIEAGNVSLPLNNSLIQGGQNLFGVKTQMQFGKLSVTTIGAQVRGRADEVVLKNGSMSRDFEIRVDEYERDRHYFLAQFFRNRYDRALANLPLINSGIVIRRLEVFITNDNRSTENLRNIVTLMDMGEAEPHRQSLGGSPGPVRNDANRLNTLLTDATYRDNNAVDNQLRNNFGLEKAVDFEHVLARRLDPREYKFNPQLGTISLNSSLLPQQVLGVAFEYTFNGKTYKVGELQDDYQNVQENQVIFMKMLKSTNPALDLPTWDLMMKNVYSLNSSQINREKFQLNIVYKDDESGVDITSLQDPGALQGIPLVDVFNLDNVNTNNDPPKDGNFDFLPGITIDPENGKIYFPQVEPFGTYLERKLAASPALQEKYVYHELYDSTQTDAQQVATKAKFFLKGRYQAEATDEIPLPGIGVAEGSVRVYSGGTLLQEDVHYRVDYVMSRVKIIDPSYLNSANDLRIELEKQELLNIQPRQLLGARFDYQFSNDVNLGGTVMHFIERPFVNRVNIGDEPTNNTIYGLDFSYRKDSRFLTKMVDYLPLIQTKEPSSVTFNAEFAQLLPGQSKLTGEDGASYIDDFEMAESPQTIAGYSNFNWKLAATPTPVKSAGTPLETTYNRGRIAWYSIDQLFFTENSRRPSNITANDVKNHYARGIRRQEVFPNRNPETGTGFEYTFDVAYYPNERGQYNYNPDVNPDGTFRPSVNPRENWGGISRDISFDTDFDNANIEYIEFWMMDPFLTGNNGRIVHDAGPGTNNETGGKLFINLGNISEDVLQDGRYEFENGLPTSDQRTNVNQTDYGYASSLQFLTDAFDNQAGSRRFQDIGIDGINDADERAFFPSLANFDDPAGDNFQHYLSDAYDDSKTSVLGRYKKFNGMEGNSPANSTEAYSVLPDKEDLNRDNIISDVEQYYEYGLDLRQNTMEVGQNYIVDKVENNIDGDKVTWYQFRIPVRQPTGNVGNIKGFKSIRFMRMYLTDFDQPVVLRFVQFQFVANQWRKFIPDISQGGPCPGNCNDIVRNFTVSTVNIEENGQVIQNSNIIPYVVPPGIKRQRDFASNIPREQNEQALQVCVEDLRDSFSKAVYKNISTDMLIYQRLKMFLHAQAPVVDGVRASLNDGDVNAFIRLGTDYTQNYYEYTVPLKVTPQSSQDINEIWYRENMIDIKFDEFVEIKMRRNREGRSLIEPYSVTMPDGRTITIMGNPDFSAVQGVMIGIQNPRSGDGLRKSVCIWANELRVQDFNKTAGWAATARLNTKLADFANVTATGSYTTFGFGGIQQKVAQRARENTTTADINTNIALDKFIPAKVGMKIPMTLQYGTIVQTPKYDPLDGDVELSNSLTKFSDKDQQETYRREIVDQTTTKSINFINVRKEKTNPQAKVRPYDIENLSLTGGYSERLQTNVITDRDFTKAYMGAVAYTYNATPKNYTPLINAKMVQSPYLRPIKDINLTPLPSRFAFRADIDRRYNELQLQARSGVRGLPSTQGIEPSYQKYFFFNRLYDLKWDLTKSLTFDYTATNRAVVDEPDGKIDADDPTLKYKNEIIWENLKKMGRNTSFNQLAALTYRLPLDKFPLTDWVSADARYGAGYTWTSGSSALISDTLNLGNTIQNNTEKSVTGKIDMVRLYNKVKFLKSINSPPPRPVAGRAPGRPGVPAPALKPGEKAPKDTTKGPELKALKAVLRAVMTARSINFRYSLNEGTLLPGYLPRTKFFGFDEGFTAPGAPFIVGRQYSLDGLYDLADSRGWYTDSSHLLNTPLSSLKTRTLSASTALEPFKNFNIQLESRQNRSDISEVFYKLPVDDFGKPLSQQEDRQNPIHTGSFSTSFLSVATLFESGKDNKSDAFEDFIRNRQVVRDKLTAENPLSDTEHKYELNSQDVLIPSFLHAYQGKSISRFETKFAKGDNMFKMFPIPNWRVDYNGLSEIEMFKKYFSSVTLSHSYSNTYNISSFTTSLEYQEQPDGLATQTNQSGEFIPYYIVNQVAIVERMAPVLGINIRTKSKVTARMEYKTERSIALNMTNAQVTQSGVKDYVIGLGYNTNNFRIPFRIGGENKVLKNDLTMRMDLTIRDNTTIQRTIVEDTQNPGQEVSLNQVTNGSLQIMIRPTIDYVINQRLNLQLYFSRNVSEPRVQNAYRNTMTEGGVQLRFSLGQ